MTHCLGIKFTSPPSHHHNPPRCIQRGSSSGTLLMARPRAMTVATMPSIFRVDLRFEGLMLPAASISMETLLAIQRWTG